MTARADITIVRTFLAFGPTGVRTEDGKTITNADANMAFNRWLERTQYWQSEAKAAADRALIAERARTEWMERYEMSEKAALNDGEDTEADPEKDG